MSQEPDFEYVLIDATIGKAHVDASGQKGGAEAHAIGCSRGGLTTKIHAAVDALGLPIRFVITPGQWGDRPQAPVAAIVRLVNSIRNELFMMLPYP